MAAANAKDAELNKLQESFDCNICFELLVDPVVGNCGHDFCRQCLEKWVARQAGPGVRCPVCRGVFADASFDTLGVCVRLRNMVELLFPDKLAARRQELAQQAQQAAALRKRSAPQAPQHRPVQQPEAAAAGARAGTTSNNSSNAAAFYRDVARRIGEGLAHMESDVSRMAREALSQVGPQHDPSSPITSPVDRGYAATRPGYTPLLPGYVATSPGYSPVDVAPGYAATSSAYTPVNIATVYAATTPVYRWDGNIAAMYAATSPAYTPATTMPAAAAAAHSVWPITDVNFTMGWYEPRSNVCSRGRGRHARVARRTNLRAS